MSTPTATATATGICANCGLDQAAAIDEGVRLALITPRTPEIRRELFHLRGLLQTCLVNCGTKGGW